MCVFVVCVCVGEAGAGTGQAVEKQVPNSPRGPRTMMELSRGEPGGVGGHTELARNQTHKTIHPKAKPWLLDKA